jgi:hypothetical protein
MSCYFQVGDQVLWNPSNSVAQIFIGEAALFARFAGCDSGVGEIIEDECHIDIAKFQHFVRALTESYSTSNNQVLRSLVGGFIPVALVLVERSGASLMLPPDEWQGWRPAVEDAGRAMPL